MAEKKLQLTIVTPEKMVVSEDVDQVNVPGVEGDLGVLYDHETEKEKGRETTHMVVSGGYLEVTDNRVIVLAETAEFLDQIDKARAEKSRIKAEEALARADLSDEEFEKAQHKLFRATARLENTLED